MGGSTSNFLYSVEVPGTGNAQESPIYLHPQAKPYLTTSLINGASSLYEVLAFSSEKHADLPFLGFRQDNAYVWKTYKEVGVLAKRLGYYLFQLKSDDQYIGIYAKNRIEWLLTDFACIYQGITSVPLYEMLQPDSLEAVFSEVPISIIACSENLAKNLLKFKNEGKVPLLAHIIIFEPISAETLSEANNAKVTLHSFYEIINQDLQGEDHPPSPDSIFTICYTSGTTGRRKGAKIAHKNLVATIAGILNNKFSFNTEDCHLSYLPLTHMLERVAVYTIIQCGAKIGLYGGDSLKIRNDLELLKPTLFISVPRLFNRIYELIIQQFNVSTGINKFLIGKALEAKMSNYHNYQQIASTVWDKLVFENVRKTLGGKIRFMVTGSAPITGEVLTFLRVVFSCPIVEGYGQTESCAGSFVTMPEDLECGHIGGPIPNLEAKIIDVPEMKYLTTDSDVMGNKAPRGELCIRGPTVFMGYYRKNEDEGVLDEDGWLHTGDIVIRLSHNGAFKIIDRKNNFFKLAQGEYVATEKVENVYLKSEFVSQIFVYGDSFQSFLIAVVVPCESSIRKTWAQEKNLNDLSFEDLCLREDLKNFILADMQTQATEAKLYGFEQVKKVYLEPHKWTTATLLTSTLKLMRYQAKMHYQGVIAELYSERSPY